MYIDVILKCGEWLYNCWYFWFLLRRSSLWCPRGRTAILLDIRDFY